MKNQNLQDERVVTQRRKINSEAYGILTVALIASILIQQYLIHAPIKQYAVEFICLIGIWVYVIIRNIMLGLNLFNDEKRAKAIPVMRSILVGAVVAAITGVTNYMKYAELYKEDGIGYFIALLAITFISAEGAVFIIFSCIVHFNRKRQAKIQSQMDDDERYE